MTIADIASHRLINQQLAGSRFRNPADLVAWMGAMQAQDLPMAEWALGIRIPGSTERSVHAAIDKGEIIRTHVLRPTWHFVPAEDLRWMIALTGPRINASLRFRSKHLGLTEALVTKSNRIIVKALKRGDHLTRQELMANIEEGGISTAGNRASHLFLRAETDGIVCSGATRGKFPTYALVEQRIRRSRRLNRDESLAELGRRYFLSHGPARLQDFKWWSGLLMAEVKRSLEMNKPDLETEKIGRSIYWFPRLVSQRRGASDSTYFLPAYDEFIISYKDRSASIDLDHQSKTVSNNGIFRPAVVINGRVSALWRRSVIKEKVVVDIRFLRFHTGREKELIQKAVRRLGTFLGGKIQMNFQKV